MGELYLVRHGQANSKAKTEEEYDKLSDLGHRQADLLGQWMRAHEAPFDQVLCGSMRRHKETTAGMGFTPDLIDPRLNEMEYFALVRDMQTTHGIAPPDGPDDFAVHMPKTLAAWHQATVTGNEPFATFEARILAALSQATKPGKRVLCVTSGGVISMVLRAALDLGTDQMARLLLPIFNSSLHKFRVQPDGTFLTAYNAVPHLDPPHLADHRTHL